jgi:hypothetical protein
MSVRTFFIVTIILIALILLAIWKVPIGLIWLVNTIFGWSIPVTLKTWFLTLVLASITTSILSILIGLSIEFRMYQNISD